MRARVRRWPPPLSLHPSAACRSRQWAHTHLQVESAAHMATGEKGAAARGGAAAAAAAAAELAPIGAARPEATAEAVDCQRGGPQHRGRAGPPQRAGAFSIAAREPRARRGRHRVQRGCLAAPWTLHAAMLPASRGRRWRAPPSRALWAEGEWEDNRPGRLGSHTRSTQHNTNSGVTRRRTPAMRPRQTGPGPRLRHALAVLVLRRRGT
eukprot:364750-Chlamydomonas_euryale.AAC.9